MSREISPLRSKRFPLTEQDHGGLHKDHASVMPNATAYPAADGYYNFYRISVHAASKPDKSRISSDTAVANNPLATAYTDVEQKMIDDAARLCGFSPKKLTRTGSKEPDDVHKVSPVNYRAHRFSNPSIYDK